MEQHITPKGHPLFFGHKEVNPDWLFGLSYPELRKAAADIARHHVSTYADTIRYWDAMNEAHDWANCFELNQDQAAGPDPRHHRCPAGSQRQGRVHRERVPALC